MSSTPKYKKQTIPVALREQVWIARMGRRFEGKCPTTWCTNNITVFDFQSGHNIPESKGGPTDITNLIPICSRCNLSMGDRYSFVEWCNLSPIAVRRAGLFHKLSLCFVKLPQRR